MRIAFRVDATPESGIGHFMRCLTLANALKINGAKTRFVCRHLPDAMRNLLESMGHELALLGTTNDSTKLDELAHAHFLGTSQMLDAIATANALIDQPTDWLVVDHYGLDHRWESALRQTTQHILAIDDIADRVHDCDLLLDQNFYTDSDTRYGGKVPPECRLLLGPRYALLRNDFHQLRDKVMPRSGPLKRILVFFGGMDSGNFTGRAIDALANVDIEGLQVDVVIGAHHANSAQIELACKKNRYTLHIQTDKISELMAASDLAIGAGGAATWERCCLGLPTFAICTAVNQTKQLADAALEGLLYSPLLTGDIILSIQRHLVTLSENSYLRRFISTRAMLVGDGRGVSRVIAKLESYNLTLRLAQTSDALQLFEWRNHPAVRAVSRHPELITWEHHQSWLANVLLSADRVLLLGVIDGIEIGAIRFDIEHFVAEVSIYISPHIKTIGLGHDFLHRAEQWLFTSRPEIHEIRAIVIANNDRSHRLFLGMDYRVVATTYSKGLS